jgi:hypothetical protein
VTSQQTARQIPCPRFPRFFVLRTTRSHALRGNACLGAPASRVGSASLAPHDAERRGWGSHAERGNQKALRLPATAQPAARITAARRASGCPWRSLRSRLGCGSQRAHCHSDIGHPVAAVVGRAWLWAAADHSRGSERDSTCESHSDRGLWFAATHSHPDTSHPAAAVVGCCRPSTREVAPDVYTDAWPGMTPAEPSNDGDCQVWNRSR